MPESAAVVDDFLAPSLAAGHDVCAAGHIVHAVVVEGLRPAVIVVFLSLYFLCWHFVFVWYSLETAAHSQCTWGMLSVWTCDHKAHDKMAFLCLCPLGSQEQPVAGGGLGRSGQCDIVDVQFQEH